MKKALALAGAVVMTATALVAPNVTFAAKDTQVNAIVQPEASSYTYWNLYASKGQTVTTDAGFRVSSKKNVRFTVTDILASSPNLNFYLVDFWSGVSIRGPVTVTSNYSGKNYYFYDVPVGTYLLRMVNNGSSTVYDISGYVYH